MDVALEAVKARVAVLVAAAAAAVVAMFLVGPVAQPVEYHDFADARSWLGGPNFQNVVSNVAFLAAAVAGFAALRVAVFEDRRERTAWIVFFFGVALTTFGSAWYHLAPSNETLLWDRLPMTLAFAGIVSATIGERVNAHAGRVALGPLVVVFAASVVQWHFSELAGRGDVRAYSLVQGLAAVEIVLTATLFPSRYTRGGDVFLLVVWYAAAKAFETFDREVFAATGGLVAGHALKHVAAAAGAWQAARMVRLRAPVPIGSPASPADAKIGT